MHARLRCYCLAVNGIPPKAQTSGEDPTVCNVPGLGLALSGGGAYGAAHVGVLQVLEAHELRPSTVTGTSSGALVGAAYAAGLPVDRIDSLTRSFRWSRIARWNISPRWGLLDTRTITAGLVQLLGDDPRIEQLPRRFGAVATDVRTRRAVTITHGSLSRALRASIAVPGLLPPVRVNGRLLADGGMVDNVPFTAARELGAERIVVVRLHARWESVRMMRTVAQTAALNADPSILLIQPDMERLAQWSVRDIPQLIAEGRRAAEVALAERALI